MLAPLFFLCLSTIIVTTLVEPKVYNEKKMATKWLYEFFTDTSNAMGIEDRIRETVTNMGNDGIIFPDGECCKTVEELRSLLVKKKILKDVSKGGWVVNKITTMTILFLLTLFCGACGNSNKTGGASNEQAVLSNTNSEVPTEYCQELVDLAQDGNAKAQCELGFFYEVGQGVSKDMNEAVKWYTKAAEQGNAIAQNNLAVCYENGRGVSKDLNEAFRYYRMAAEQGQVEALRSIARFYAKGIGMPQDFSEAAKWYRKAADKGHADAQNNLGNCYLNGYGVQTDFSEAAKWFEKAAEQGHADAQCSMGFLYQMGYGVDKNLDEAKKWYEKSAAQGHPDAEYSFGYCYANEEGGNQDIQKALYWLEKAAKQGHQKATEYYKALKEQY